MESSEKVIKYLEALNDKLDLQSYDVEEPKKDSEGYLITFGCSWTYGLGSGYKPGMTQDQYDDVSFNPKICYENSWRKFVCDELNFENINFSLPTSSNDAQFMLAERFFSSDYFKDIKDTKPIHVLWGITDLARKTIWSNISKSYITLFPNYSLSADETDDILQKLYYKNSFNDDIEREQLQHKIVFWDYFFEQLNVNNFWFDSFSSNNYSIEIKTLIDYQDEDRDLLYFLCMENSYTSSKEFVESFLNKNDSRHTSFGVRDNHKIEFLLRQHLINPYTLHPVKVANQQIAKFFIDSLTSDVTV